MSRGQRAAASKGNERTILGVERDEGVEWRRFEPFATVHEDTERSLRLLGVTCGK